MTMLYLARVLLFIQMMLLCCKASSMPCRGPSQERMNSLHHRLLQGSKQWMSHEATDVQSAPVLTSVFEGEMTCPSPREAVRSNDTSTCPSSFVREHDPGRIPSTIVHAHCRCNACQISGLKSQNRQQYLCEPVYRFLPVLKRQDICINGEYNYAVVVQRVSVACRCARTGTGNNRKIRKHHRGRVSANKKAPENFEM